MKYTKYTAMTCNRARKELGSAPRSYGYTIAMNPPVEWTIDGEDIEGLGWVPCIPPKKIVVKWQGWYKDKSVAVSRAVLAEQRCRQAELNKSHSVKKII